MENIPQFLRRFSKKASGDERQRIAQEIRVKRTEYFAREKNEEGTKRELQQQSEDREKRIADQLQSIQNLKIQIEELSDSVLKKNINYLKLRKIRADIVLQQEQYDAIKNEHAIKTIEETERETSPEEEMSSELDEARKMLDDFYLKEQEKWVNSEYTKEDITENFSEEHLASLSLKDYILLLRRFPGAMVAHVTRQGVRDHIGMVWHRGGEGEYVDGFMRMVQDGRLRSTLGVYLLEKEKDERIAKFLFLDTYETKQEALEYLDLITKFPNIHEPGSYADKMAIHFATEEVADIFYGSEKGNEIFIAYPSVYIASQYYFSGQLRERDGNEWNDAWVWANEEKGMDINAGIVFLPEEAQVDRKTGSRYEFDENKNPIKNSEYKDFFRRVVDSDDFYDFASQVMNITGRINQSQDDPNLRAENRELFEKLEPFRIKLEQDFGIIDRRLQFSILDYRNLSRISTIKKNIQTGLVETEYYSVNYFIEEALKQEGILFIESKNTVSSKEFWEDYFKDYPDKRPSKIVYYKGSDPTQALLQWKQENGIIKETDDGTIGFPERYSQRNDPPAIAGVDRFKTLATRIIEEYFGNK